MSEFVLDCSVTMAWVFADEETPATNTLLRRLTDGTAIAPQVWSLEVANVLAIAERKGRITAAKSAAIVAAVSRLPILIDDQTAGRALNETLALARTLRITSYDASYLELANRAGLPLATLDTRLAAHANSLGVLTLPD